jgi:hypothetical protein
VTWMGVFRLRHCLKHGQHVVADVAQMFDHRGTTLAAPSSAPTPPAMRW